MTKFERSFNIHDIFKFKMIGNKHMFLETVPGHLASL